MKRLPVLLTCLTPWLFCLSPTIAFAGEAKVEQVPAVDPSTQRISLHARNATAQDIIDQLAKASGLSLTISDQQQGQPQGPVPTIYYDVDFNDLPNVAALDYVGKILNRQMQADESGEHIQVLPEFPAGYYNPYNGGQFVSGPLRLTAWAVSLQTNFPPNPRNSSSIEVDFRTDGDTSRTVAGPPTAVVETATDDQGKTLTPVTVQRNRFEQMASISRFSASVRFKCPDPSPKQIAALKGKLQWQTPSMYSQITFTNLTDGKPTKVTVGGFDAELSAPEKNGDSWKMELSLRRGSASTKDWTDKRDVLARAFFQSTVTAINGKALNINSTQMGMSSRDQMTATVFVNGSADASPNTLIWKTIQATNVLEVPFEASNLPVP